MCYKARGGRRAFLRFRAPNTALGKPCSAAIMREASAEVVTKAFFQPSEFISLSALVEGEGTVPVWPFCCVLAAFSRDSGSYGDEGGAAEGRGKAIP